MKVSTDRSTWESLGDWKVTNQSIFAMNSDTHKFTDTQKTIIGSGHKISTGKKKSESRVLNISGLVIGDDIEDCRLKSIEIRSLLENENDLYFLEEYYNKVAYGCVSNINDNIGRATYRGRTNTISFSLSMSDPYWQDLVKTTLLFDAGDDIIISYSDVGRRPTDYTIELTCITASTIVNDVMDDIIELSAPITMGVGDKLSFSSEGASFVATKTISSVTSNILGLVEDVGFYTDGLVLTPGSNTLILSAAIKAHMDVSVSFYGRSI